MSVESKIKQIYELHRQSGLYEDSFENTIYKLTNAYDYFYLEMFKQLIAKVKSGLPYNFRDQNWEALNDYRHAYRACIKFVYKDCKHGTFDTKIRFSDISKYQEEIKGTVSFNYIRNAVDRYKLGKYSANLIGDKLYFEHKQGGRSLIYDVYSRSIADEIPGGKNSNDDIKTINFDAMIVELSFKKQEFQSKKLFKPANHELRELIYNFFYYYLGDLDSKIGYLQPTTYTLGEYLLVYCYLTAIDVYKTAYLLSLKSDNDLVYQPSILYPKERLIADIAEVVHVEQEDARAIIKDMTYDYRFQKDRITLYQPLFEIGDSILSSTSVLFRSYVIDKAMKYFDCKGTNKENLSIYHRYMSDKMNHRMAKNLPLKYPNLVTFENKILTIDQSPKAEVDLLVFDTRSKTAALIELKNYSPVDNDADAQKKEERINKAIESRLEKDKRVLDNLGLFFEQNGISKEYLNYQFSSLIVTNEYAGGVGVKENIKVLDEALFYYLLRLFQGNLKEFMAFVEKGDFFNILEKTIKIGDASADYTYKGITVGVINK